MMPAIFLYEIALNSFALFVKHFPLVIKFIIMKKNMSTVDRTIRIVAAIIIAVLFFMRVITGTWGIVLTSFAAVLLVTSIIGFCPLYTVLGINTCRRSGQ
jgi:hypothetical protein